MIEKVNLSSKFLQFDEHWSPRIVGQVNDCHVKIAKIEGAFVWHHHEHEDEMFLVIKGRLRMQIRGQDDLLLEPGEFVIIPRGTEHRPQADAECEIMLFEPAGTLNTGNVQNDLTVEAPKAL